MQIKVDHTRDVLVSKRFEDLVYKLGLKQNDSSLQAIFTDIASCYTDKDIGLAQKLYEYLSLGWLEVTEDMLRDLYKLKKRQGTSPILLCLNLAEWFAWRGTNLFKDLSLLLRLIYESYGVKQEDVELMVRPLGFESLLETLDIEPNTEEANKVLKILKLDIKVQTTGLVTFENSF